METAINFLIEKLAEADKTWGIFAALIFFFLVHQEKSIIYQRKRDKEELEKAKANVVKTDTDGLEEKYFKLKSDSDKKIQELQEEIQVLKTKVILVQEQLNSSSYNRIDDLKKILNDYHDLGLDIQNALEQIKFHIKE